MLNPSGAFDGAKGFIDTLNPIDQPWPWPQARSAASAMATRIANAMRRNSRSGALPNKRLPSQIARGVSAVETRAESISTDRGPIVAT